MTDDLRTIEAGDVAIRQDAEGDGRTITGYAYRWGQRSGGGSTAEYGELSEGFEPGAFQPAIAARGERPWPMLDRHRGTVVGAVRFQEDAVGLRFDGRLLDTPAGAQYAASVPAGADGVSLEFMYRGAKSRREGRSIIHTAIPKIAALAGVYVPAYEGATLALRDESGGLNTMEVETTAVEAEPIAERAIGTASASAVGITADQARALAMDAATEVMRAYAERGVLTVSEVDPLAGYRNLGELYAAGSKADADPELRAYAARALADTVFTAGANAGLASGNLVTQDIKRIVNAGRPAITAFGGPKPIGDVAGLTLSWAYFDGTLADYVAAQSAEKAEIESAAVDIKLATEGLITYAGGSDISYQVIKRGSPSVLDSFARIILAAWAAVTDAAFVTELETGTVNVDLAEAITAVDLTELTAHLITASLAVEAATGQPAQFVLASTTAFTKAANLIAPSSTTVVAAGGMDLRGLTISLGGLPIIHAPGVTAGKLIASNELAAAWYEDGPFQASAEDVAKLGRNQAYWSMGAGARFVPAGIVEIFDVTP
jgi:HK97 family phage prohead protease